MQLPPGPGAQANQARLATAVAAASSDLRMDRDLGKGLALHLASSEPIFAPRNPLTRRAFAWGRQFLPVHKLYADLTSDM